MKITSIHAREIAMRLRHPFETSFGVIQDRRVLLLRVETTESVGWGESTAFASPFYNAETTDTVWLALREFLAPLALGKEFTGPAELLEEMEGVRGHEMAKAAIETAAWDALAKAQSMPLHRILGGTQAEIPCGVSLGIPPEIGPFLDRIERELAAGYRRIKLKIKPQKDVELVAAVRQRFPGIDLTVDANSAYSLADAPVLKELDKFGLTYIEQPLAWNEIYEHAKLQRELKTPICLDECIHGLRDTKAALELGACKVINIKLGRVSGHCEAKKIQRYCMQRNIPVWSGGMFESGIGRAHNIAMSTLPGFIFPGDVSASQRYWEEDVIEPEVTVSSQGTIKAPDGPGIGYAVREGYIERLTTRTERWRAKAAVTSYATPTA